MKILCVVQRYYPAVGGAENLIKTYLDFLSLNHGVTVFTSDLLSIDSFWKKTNSIIPNNDLNYKIKRYSVLIPSEIRDNKYLQSLPLSSNYPGPFMPELWSDLLNDELDYDLIITTAFPYDHIIPAFIAAKKHCIPIITIPLIHSEFPELFLTGMRLSFLYSSQSVFVLSQNEKDLLIKFGINPSKICLIKPYVKTPELIQKKYSSFKTKYDLENKKVILFVGSKSTVKGILFLIDAMKQIWKRYENTVLLLIGPNTKEYVNYFNSLPQFFKNKIIDLGIADNLTKNLAFETCDIFVLPSKSESFGLVFVEAWIHKKPVIGCNISSTIELIEHMKNGLIVKFDDVNALSNSILQLLQDNHLSQNLGEMGYRKSNIFTNIQNLADFESQCMKIVNQFRSNQY